MSIDRGSLTSAVSTVSVTILNPTNWNIIYFTCTASIEKAVACGPNEPLYADTDILIVQKSSKRTVEMRDMATQTDPIIKRPSSTSFSSVSWFCFNFHWIALFLCEGGQSKREKEGRRMGRKWLGIGCVKTTCR